MLRCRHFVEHLPYFGQRTHCGGQWIKHQGLHCCLTVLIEQSLHHQLVNHHMGAVERGELRREVAKGNRPNPIAINQAGDLHTAITGQIFNQSAIKKIAVDHLRPV